MKPFPRCAPLIMTSALRQRAERFCASEILCCRAGHLFCPSDAHPVPCGVTACPPDALQMPATHERYRWWRAHSTPASTALSLCRPGIHLLPLHAARRKMMLHAFLEMLESAVRVLRKSPRLTPARATTVANCP